MTKKVSMDLGGNRLEFDFATGIGLTFNGKVDSGATSTDVGVFATGGLPNEASEHDILDKFLPLAITSLARAFDYPRDKPNAPMLYVVTAPVEVDNDGDKPEGLLMEGAIFAGTAMNSEGTDADDIVTGVVGAFTDPSHMLDHVLKLLEHILDSEPDLLTELVAKCYMLFSLKGGMSKGQILDTLKKATGTTAKDILDPEIEALLKRLKKRS